MLTVVIIDDEALVRVGLKSIINWEEQGCHIVGEASNGSQGLEIIRKYKPDIVITDIKMPVMDGIEMLMASVNEGGRSKFIVLSSYDEFNLVRQAMKSGAVEYLIKLELEPETLINAISQAKNKILELQAESERKNFLERHVKVNKPVMREEFFRKLIGRVISNRKELEENIGLLEIDLDEERLVCAFIKINETESLNKFGKEDMQLLDFSVINIVDEILNDAFKGYSIKWSRGEYVAIFSFNGEWESEYWRLKLSGTTERIIQMLRQYFSISVNIGISGIHRDFFEMDRAFLECNEALQYESFNGSGNCIFYGEHTDKQEQQNNRLIAIVKRYIREHIKEEIKLSELANASSLSAGYLSTLFKQVTGRNIIDYVAEVKINYAKTLLRESNLKIYEVSSMLGYKNAYYFSRVFKKVTGMTPTEYIN